MRGASLPRSSVGDRVMGPGAGTTKKEAEMCAAREALTRVSSLAERQRPATIETPFLW
jgi:hypothetical protein